MSKENVALFIKHVNKNEDLIRRIAKTDQTTDWVEIAKTAGFEFTPEEFAEVVSDTLGRTTTARNAVREYMMAQTTMSKGEMIQLILNSVVGGEAAFVQCNPLFVRVPRVLNPLDKAE